MNDRTTKIEKMSELLQKIAEITYKVDPIKKNSENPFHKNKYADINTLLSEVKPLIEEAGLVLLQPINNGFVITRIIDPETGDNIESAIQLPDVIDPQKIGSAITYYRRYTLQSLLGLQAEDDDANKASQKDLVEIEKAWINMGDKAWVKAVGQKLPIAELEKFYKISKANKEQYLKEIA